MFRALGQFVAQHSKPILALWIAIAVALTFVAPPWESIIHDGEFSFLPADSPSRKGEDLFRSAFSKDFLGSNIVVVVRRESSKDGLLPVDRDFIEKVLRPRIEKFAEDDGGLAEDAESNPDADEPPASHKTRGHKSGPKRSVITAVRTFSDPSIGHLLDSEDRKASLVMVNLRTELFAEENRPTLDRIERMIGRDGDLRNERLIPPGLDLTISGSATIGRDMRVAESRSAESTELWTIGLVIVILLVIYRSPLLAFVPLVTVFVAVHISLKLISLMAQQEWVHPFSGIDVYITVVAYGAGVDYCVFLMSRYKEEMDGGLTMDEAMSAAVRKVGGALVASAATTIVGLAMMVFAKFGKFQEAGVAMSLSLCFALVASLTFTPALMMFFGKWAFWPHMRTERIAARAGWFSPTSLVSRLLEHDLVVRFWERVGELIVRSPGRVWLTSVLLMAPFVVIALKCHDVLSYGLMSELPADQPSVIGSKAVQDHFSPGVTGPVTVLVVHRDWDFSQTESEAAVRTLSDRIIERKDELELADLRSLSHPFGITPAATQVEEKNQRELDGMTVGRRIAERGIRRKKVLDHYVSDRGALAKHITRLDVVFEDKPFSRNSIRRMDEFSAVVAATLPDELRAGAQLYFIGPTPSIRDLKAVTGHDQILINILVISSVFLILVALVRHLAVAAYLIASVFFSYLVTLGVTYAVFYALDPVEFAGLDWKVPIFLFVILIAVGEDYNIYLIARIEEESQRLGPLRGITSALSRTGGIISSCGVIMAGTFSALIAGELTGMNQLGFALAFGVILDTFVVRPILVPAYLVLLNSGRFGWIGQFLGARPQGPRELQAVVAGQERT